MEAEQLPTSALLMTSMAVENREEWRKLVAKSFVVPPTTLAVKG